jgi:hypothetical protein
MHRLSARFFLSPSDVGIEKYQSIEIAERMKPVDPVEDDELLAFAQVVSALLEESPGEATMEPEATCRKK